MLLKFKKIFRESGIIYLLISFLFYYCILSFASGIALGSSADEDNNKNTQYNIVMIVVNALRADHLGCYGYFRNTSPNIDRFAQDGIIFDRAISQSYWTLPSLVSILTSKFVCMHNVNSRDVKLGKDEKIFAEILRIYGYSTAAFTCGLDTAAAYGMDRGFDIYNTYDGNEVVGSFYDTMPRTIKWLNENKDKNFFLFLHSYDVHPPYKHRKGENFSKGYKGIFEGLQLDYDMLKRIDGDKFYSDGRQISLEQKDIDYIVSSYDDCIKYLDGFIGILMEELKHLNLYEKTIIVLCSEHGEELGERRTFNRFGNQNLYQEVIRIPLIIKYPSLQLKGRRINSLVQIVDIMPTVLDLLKIPAGHDLQGSSLASLIKNDTNEIIHKYAFSEASRHKWAILRHDGWKLLYSYGVSELYNINADPLERNNLARQNLDVQTSLMKEFFLWRQHHEKEDVIDNYIKLDPQHYERLKKAGYW